MPETHDTPEVELWLGQKIRYRNGQALYAPLRLKIPSLFWHLQDYPDGVVEVDGKPKEPPIVERARSVESEEPYRVGRGVAVRLWPRRRAVVVGWWKHREALPAESEVLAEQLGGQMLDAETMERLGPIADWDGPDEGTDDSEIQPDTVLVYDGEGRPVMREGSTKPFSDEQYAAVFGMGTGLIQVVEDPGGVQVIDVEEDPYGPLVLGASENEKPVRVPELSDPPVLDFTKDDVVGWVGGDGVWHPGPAADPDGH